MSIHELQKGMTRTNDTPFQMRVSKAWLKSLDDWRRTQPDIPSRAEAVRRLVELGRAKP